MTDPVDTDALRASSKFLRKSYPGTAAQVANAADELDRLHAVIENAPHFAWCSSLMDQTKCDCWKADVL